MICLAETRRTCQTMQRTTTPTHTHAHTFNAQPFGQFGVPLPFISITIHSATERFRFMVVTPKGSTSFDCEMGRGGSDSFSVEIELDDRFPIVFFVLEKCGAVA